jgi:acetylornithine/succinyldiaminopimelate/putrescine aminotransferase
MAKPLANGVPIGAVMVTDKVADAITTGKNILLYHEMFNILILS